MERGAERRPRSPRINCRPCFVVALKRSQELSAEAVSRLTKTEATEIDGQIDLARPKHDRYQRRHNSIPRLIPRQLAASPGLRGLFVGSKEPSTTHRQKRRTVPMRERPKSDVAQERTDRTAIPRTSLQSTGSFTTPSKAPP